MKNNQNKVVLGLSGGVDSTAAALLLKEQGYEVTGLYFNVLNESCINSKRNIEAGLNKAKAAAEQLGIELICRDLSSDFKANVIDTFCREYLNGRTPNPCVICNPLIKFRALEEAADEVGAKWIATGHYAGTYYDDRTKLWYITKAKNESKDQSYMLYRLGQQTISRLLMPLNEYEDKAEIRALARNSGMNNAEAKDSQEICFIDAEDDYVSFIYRQGFNSPEGEFVDSEGKILGKHKGIVNYTIGQRKGLGVALGKPAFVTNIDCNTNRICLGDNEELFSEEIRFADGRFTINNLCELENGLEVFAKIRYAARPAKGTLYITASNGESVSGKLIFDTPQRAAAPGQSIVFYSGNKVVGGGFIEQL